LKSQGNKISPQEGDKILAANLAVGRIRVKHKNRRMQHRFPALGASEKRRNVFRVDVSHDFWLLSPLGEGRRPLAKATRLLLTEDFEGVRQSDGLEHRDLTHVVAGVLGLDVPDLQVGAVHQPDALVGVDLVLPRR
jgi:hypothetical protein